MSCHCKRQKCRRWTLLTVGKLAAFASIPPKGNLVPLSWISKDLSVEGGDYWPLESSWALLGFLLAWAFWVDCSCISASSLNIIDCYDLFGGFNDNLWSIISDIRLVFLINVVKYFRYLRFCLGKFWYFHFILNTAITLVTSYGKKILFSYKFFYHYILVLL